MKSFFKNFYLDNRFYLFGAIVALLYITGHFFPVFYGIAKILLFIQLALLIIDFLLLYNSSKYKIKAVREVPDRLSNGDVNKIRISLKNNYAFSVSLKIIDEIPHQFQKRDFLIKRKLKSGAEKNLYYTLRPTERGEYHFGNMNIYVSTLILFIRRRFIYYNENPVPVYPSFMQMRKYELMAISNRLTEAGIKKIRRISNNKEFDRIRKYVVGDDFRTINWKATARKTELMVNQYQDEKAQRVYSIIDMGRSMKMPFDELSLLDYAINASLVISNIAMIKHDKAGLITFCKKVEKTVPAERKKMQMNKIMDVLYKQDTDFSESNLEVLYAAVKKKLNHRSLLLIYTNFEGFSSMERQLKYFKLLSKSHLVVVVFFENTELKEISEQRPGSVEDIYIKTITEKLAYEKKQIVKELKKHGIYSVLTEPQNLTVNTINKYLEMKAKGLI